MALADFLSVSCFEIVFMSALAMLFGVSMFLCYLVWLQRGYTWLMPFVSDFGVFKVGTSGGGILLVIAILMGHCIVSRQRPEEIGRLSNIRLVGGILLALSIVGVGVSPCDAPPFWHGMCANTCFISGFVYSILTCMIYKQRGKRWNWIAAFVLLSITLMISMMHAQNAMLRETLSPLYPNDPSYPNFDRFNPMTYENYRHWCSGARGLNGSETVTMMPCWPPFSEYNCPVTGPGPHSTLFGNIAALLEWSLLIANAFPCVYSVMTEIEEVKGREAMQSDPLLVAE